MSACVSPPQPSVSHIVQPAASMAAAAATALPPFAKIIAPAFADNGLPVIAIQCFACSAGFCVAERRGSAAPTACACVRAGSPVATRSATVSGLIIVTGLCDGGDEAPAPSLY